MDKISGIATKIGGGKAEQVVDKGIDAVGKKLSGGNGGDPAKKLDSGRENLGKDVKDIPGKFSH